MNQQRSRRFRAAQDLEEKVRQQQQQQHEAAKEDAAWHTA
jgi:5'-3' exonuclease